MSFYDIYQLNEAPMRMYHPKKSLGKKIVLIIGAGFAGLNAAKKLSRHPDVHVLLVDERNHHLFQPLLYQVATAGLNVADIAVPIRSLFKGVENVEVHLGKIDRVDLKNKTVSSTSLGEEFEFDYLILACGVRHSYFGHPEWEKHAPGLKTLENATEIRRKILTSFELAESEDDPVLQDKLLTFVIVGGGPTGVELAGAIAEISRTVMVGDFKRIDPSRAKVILIEAGPRLLASFTPQLSQHSKEALEELGVEVKTNTKVLDIQESRVQVENQLIEAKCIFWAAGVEANHIEIFPSVERDRSGRVKVNADLTVGGFQNVFVIGDMASVQLDVTRTVPGQAPAAIQEGKYVAKAILALIKNKSIGSFHYFDKGQMATIGKNKAVLQFQNIEMHGFFAWFSWLFLHIFYLIGFKNKVFVFFTWAWNYLFSKRGSRLIMGNPWKD